MEGSIPNNIVMAIFVSHFLADFVTQEREIAKQKSKSLKALTFHVFWYFCTFNLGLLFFKEGKDSLLLWVAFNSAAHWVVDYFTSRLFAKLWPKEEYLAILVYGLDQTVHLALLVWTYSFLKM